MDLTQLKEKLQTAIDDLTETDFQLLEELDSLLNQRGNTQGYNNQGQLKLAIFSAKKYDLKYLSERNQNRFELNPIEAALSIETVSLAAGYKAISLFVNDEVTDEVANELAKLGVELIALRCAGFNNVDLQACQKNKIDVVRVPAYSPFAVAEHTIALIMMLNRHLHQAYLRNRIGSFVLDGLTGFDLKNKTVGVIGTGQIGLCLINILRGFGCRVIAFDKCKNPKLQEDDQFYYGSLEDVFTQADIISLHVPLLEETKYLINAKAIEKMKTGVMIINTSRGGLIDTKALIDGLKSGKIGSAGLDVYEEESGIFFHDLSDKVLTDDLLARLMTFNNVVITSHQAFLTEDALRNIADTTLNSVSEYASGKRGSELSSMVTDSK